MEQHLPKLLKDKNFSPNVSAKQKDQLKILVKVCKFDCLKVSRQNRELSNFCLNGKERASLEFCLIEEEVLASVSPVHGWRPKIAKIEEICNPALEKKFKERKNKCFSSYSDLKFHGTDNAGIINIPKEGFRDPKEGKVGMFGKGLYFTTCTSKSAQAIYTKGSNKILLCELILGKSKRVESHDYNLTLEKICNEGFDSVFAPSNTKAKGGVIHDDFVVYDKDQALPRYIIHYTS